MVVSVANGSAHCLEALEACGEFIEPDKRSNFLRMLRSWLSWSLIHEESKASRT